jgi:hypothetical protein
MKNWLVYKCVNSPVKVVHREGCVYHSDYEKSFDTKEEAEAYIKQRNNKQSLKQ